MKLSFLPWDTPTLKGVTGRSMPLRNSYTETELDQVDFFFYLKNEIMLCTSKCLAMLIKQLS